MLRRFLLVFAAIAALASMPAYARQSPVYFLFGEVICKDIKPTNAKKTNLCFLQYRNDSDPKKCLWIGSVTFAPPDHVHGRVTAMVPYEQHGSPVCFRIPMPDIVPSFVAHGPEVSINSGPTTGSYFLVKNTKDNCFWQAQRDPQDPDRVLNFAPYKFNGKTVCEK
jgi:hypothetical protein